MTRPGCRVIACACALAWFAAAAETAVWTNVVSSSAQWKTAGNWTDADGQVLTAPPANGSDIRLTNLPAMPSYTIHQTAFLAKQAINTGSVTGQASRVGLDANGINPVVGTVTGDMRHTIVFPGAQANHLQPPERTMSLTDASAFAGWWQVGAPRGVLNFLDSLAAPAIGNVSAHFRPSVKVSGADQTVTLGSLYVAGALEKRGPGALKVGSSSGGHFAFFHKAGTLEFAGAPDAGLGTIFAKAALHLDATRTDTLTTVQGDDGYVHVTDWRDANGHDSHADDWQWYQPGAASDKIVRSNTPFLSDARSLTGLPYVDFGSKYGRTDFGPTNCLLKVRPYLTNVRAVFYAVDMDQGRKNAYPVADDQSFNFLSDGSYLFNGDWASPNVLYGDITANGIKTAYNACPIGTYSNQYVLGVATVGNTTIGTLGCDRRMKIATGGFRLGEVLIYTNELTRAERTRITDYLMAKWQGTTGGVDADALVVSSATAPVRVDAGRTALVRNLNATAGGFVKSGAGTLEVEALVPSNATVTVEGGSVRFPKAATVSTAAPAANPYAWFDANSDSDRFDTSTVGEVEYLTAWRDVRAESSKAMSAQQPNGSVTRQAPRLPRLVPNACGTLSAVDFGYEPDGNHSGMYLPDHASSGSAKTYAGFMVVSIKNPLVASKQMAFFGSRSIDFYRNEKGYLIARDYLSSISAPQSAIWSVNGRIVDPLVSQPELLSTDFFVVGFSSDELLRFDSLTQSQNTDANCGNAQIGEVLLYDRKLTEEERRQTEAYLMKRWLGRTLPAAAAPQPDAIRFAADADLILESETDLSVKTVSGGNGNIVKRGAGIMTVAGFACGAEQTVSVERGALSLTLTNAANFLVSALFHLDASDAASLTDVTVSGGVTNVNSWADRRANGFKATAKSSTYATVAPKLVTVETASGVSRPVIDFGELCGRRWVGSTGETKAEWTGAAAGMDFSKSFSAVKDAYTVFSDAHGANRAWIFGEGRSFIRDFKGNGTIYANWETTELPYVTGGNERDNVRIDGVKGSRTSKIPSGFHVIDVYDRTTAISGLANGSTTGSGTEAQTVSVAGGCYIAETLAFDHTLDAAERDYLESYLAYKWKGSANPGAFRTNTFSSVTLAEGTTLSLALPYAGVERLEIRSLAGCGTLEADRADGVRALGVTVADGACRMLTVAGTVAFDESVAVTFDGDIRNLAVGEYPFFVADGLENVDLTKWTISNDVSRLRHPVSLYRRGNVIGLKVQPRGTILMLR